MKVRQVPEETFPPKSSEPLLVGLIGRNIGASRSPLIHQREAAAQGFDLRYTLFDLEVLDLGLDDLKPLLNRLQGEGYAGVNITHPVKQAVIPLLDQLSVEANQIGAVNTVAFGADGMTGHNTDCSGFARSFRHGLPDAVCDRVVQLGAGGAGAASAYAMLAMGTRDLTLVDVDAGRATDLAAKLRALFPEAIVSGTTDPAPALARADGLVHATPTGMAEHPGLPLSAALLNPRFWVSEIVYFPLETELLKQAQAAGCRTLNGGGMAVFQAVGAFEIFTGRPADGQRMLDAFLVDAARG